VGGNCGRHCALMKHLSSFYLAGFKVYDLIFLLQDPRRSLGQDDSSFFLSMRTAGSSSAFGRVATFSCAMGMTLTVNSERGFSC